MKQKWLMFVTIYNQKALKNHRVFLGPKPWAMERNLSSYYMLPTYFKFIG